MKKLIAGLIFISIILVGCGGSESNAEYNLGGRTGLTKEQKQEDMDCLMDKMSRFYVYQDIIEGAPSALFERGNPECEAAMKKIVNTKTDLEYIEELNRFLGSLGNWHTAVSMGLEYYNSENSGICSRKEFKTVVEEYNALLDVGNYQLPFYIDANNSEQEAVIKKSFIPKLSIGDRIVSINDKTYSDFRNEINSGIKFPEKIKIKAVAVDNKAKSVVITQKTESSVARPQSELYTEFSKDKEYAYIHIPMMKAEFQKTIEEFFDFAYDYENMIVDVRGNGGGMHSLSSYIISHISAKSKGENENSLTKIKYSGYDVSKKGINNIADLLGMPYDVLSADDNTTGLSESKYDFYKITRTIPVNKQKTYMGQVYVLQNENCFSATGLLLQDIKQGDFGIITVGATAKGTGALGEKMVMLPNSKLNVRVPTHIIVDENGGVDEIVGIKPNYEVESASASAMSEFYAKNPDGNFFTSEYDPQFMKVMELIEQGEE